MSISHFLQSIQNAKWMDEKIDLPWHILNVANNTDIYGTIPRPAECICCQIFLCDALAAADFWGMAGAATGFQGVVAVTVSFPGDPVAVDGFLGSPVVAADLWSGAAIAPSLLGASAAAAILPWYTHVARLFDTYLGYPACCLLDCICYVDKETLYLTGSERMVWQGTHINLTFTLSPALKTTVIQLAE